MTSDAAGAPRSVLVTGGGRGIGAATSLLCAARGWAVAVNYTSDAAAAGRVVAAIRADGGTARRPDGDEGRQQPGDTAHLPGKGQFAEDLARHLCIGRGEIVKGMKQAVLQRIFYQSPLRVVWFGQTSY